MDELDWRYKDRQRTTIYYAYPYSAWERVRHEKQNKLIRRFVPQRNGRLANSPGQDVERGSNEKQNKLIRRLVTKRNGRLQTLPGRTSSASGTRSKINSFAALSQKERADAVSWEKDCEVGKAGTVVYLLVMTERKYALELIFKTPNKT